MRTIAALKGCRIEHNSNTVQVHVYLALYPRGNQYKDNDSFPQKELVQLGAVFTLLGPLRREMGVGAGGFASLVQHDEVNYLTLLLYRALRSMP
ncbi:hypothetical protein RRG08_028709 [Elysia crispata]|uniref:Uncharacterized protein n=1 Tax=Elysia crispata TaxID=231223 RepID=A0AAE0XNN7_9GAST|nr:hypothetical protein RRG08_028709 [Elysia crispata]